uniref:Cytochrome c oxidase subunit 2 n=1 Tax=Evania appendigaster TaxID=27486 RepID=C8YLX6_EVAAP|nr:cytochrome c oxidase subunit II [Evania appendigaster]ACL36001.1 cytochrome c oxidase subunit II [Evania appendigaster]
MATWMMFGLQDGASPLMKQLIFFHDYSMTFMLMILSYIIYTIIFTTSNSLTNKNIMDNQHLEITWTIIPMIVLLFMASPSLKILYLMDETIDPFLNVKISGHQWYWSYEIKEFNIEFDSFLNSSLSPGSFRLLDTDTSLVLPKNLPINLIATSTDVIHSWTIPSLGVKMDAVPGRLNQSPVTIKRYGHYFGQCSEICGANHSFMPISLEISNMKLFVEWVKKIAN